MNPEKRVQPMAASVGVFCLIIASGLLAARRNNNAMKSETGNSSVAKATAPTQMKSTAATPEDARQFVEGAENRLLTLWVAAQRASWVQERGRPGGESSHRRTRCAGPAL
jgi:hypothetical protein